MKAQLLLGLALALPLAACGHVERGAPEAAGEEGGSSRGESVAEFLACARQWIADYEPAETPGELARDADAVVTGKMVAVKRDPVSALEVNVDQVVTGEEELVTDGSVRVELPEFDHAACPGPVPSAYGVFFLDDLPNGSTATLIQGFLIEDANGRLVSVWEPFSSMPGAWQDLDSVDEVLAAVG